MKILSHRKNEKDKFEMLCRTFFSYLENDFNCKLDSVIHDVYGTYLVFKNSTTAVEISFAPYEGYIYVDVVRLVNGKIPANPIFIKSNTVLDEYNLFDIVAIRNPAFKLTIPPFSEWDKEKVIKKDLRLRANLLKKYAADILRGNFSIFPELEKIVKKRAEKIRKTEKEEPKKAVKEHKK